MSFTATLQIQPFPKKIQKRESLYTCIRYASNLMKFKTDMRKHNRTIPNDDLPPLPPPQYTYNEKSNYYYDQEEQQEEEETMTLYDEKEQELTTILKQDCYYSRRESQLALPSRTRYTPINIIHQLDNNEDEEEDEYDDFEEFDEEEEEDEENHLDHYFLQEEDPLTCALQKLSGITFPATRRTKKSSTAVLITLSPCALAAANAARQKRQKMNRLTH